MTIAVIDREASPTPPLSCENLVGRSPVVPDARAALARLADDVRRRRKGAGADDAQECTVVAATALTLQGRRTGKTFLAKALFVSSTGVVLLLDRPAPSAAFELEWAGADPLTFDLVRSRRTSGRFEVALALRDKELALTSRSEIAVADREAEA